MADISSYLASIKNAERGEIVRDSIIRALQTLSEHTGNASTLNTHPSSYFATYVEVWNKQNKLTFDEVPTENSTNPVYSKGLYKLIGNFGENKKTTDDFIVSPDNHIF